MTSILVTGGAGYIGSHTCLNLSERGYTPVVFDNLTNGHREFVQWGPFEQGDVRDRGRLDEVFHKYRPAAVVHFAGLIEVGQSVIDPASFFDHNVAGSITLFAAALNADVDKIVFSSTCATYGIPKQVPIPEDHVQLPINPYGQSKLMVEQVLRELHARKKLKSVILRYFNAAGADEQGRVGEWHDPETHLIPVAINAALAGSHLKIFGSTHPTRDGTCVRDYVHVSDLAEAHGLGVEYLLRGGTSTAFNLGTGRGTSVNEIVDAIRTTSKKSLPVEFHPEREGDAPELVADNVLARTRLGWQPRHHLPSIIETAWNWHTQDRADRFKLHRTGK